MIDSPAMAHSRSAWTSYGLVALMLTLTIAALAGSRRWFDAFGNADALDAAVSYPEGESARIVVLDRVNHDNHLADDSTTRLNVWAPGADAPHIRKQVPGARMLAASAELLWLYSPEHGVHARDPATLELRIDEQGLARRNPSLVAGLMAPDPFESWKMYAGVDEDTGRFVVTTKEGRQLWIDPASFEAAPFSGTRVQPFLTFSGRCAAAKQAPRPMRVELRGDGPRQEATIDGRSAGEYLTPERIEVCSVDGSDGSIALILHRAVLDEPSPSRLTALSPAGGSPWTATLTGESGWSTVRILSASLSADAVILVVQGDRGSFWGGGYGLMTLDRSTGRVTSAPSI